MVKKSGSRGEYRSFTVERVGKHGSCKTKGKEEDLLTKPLTVQQEKHFSEFCRTKRIKGICTLLVTARETTKGAAGKMFTYKLNRRKLQKPNHSFRRN